LFEKLEEQGRPSPLDERPVIYDMDYQEYVKMFMDLTTERGHIPMSESIPYLTYSAYLSYFSIFDTLDDLETDIRRLRQMDIVYVNAKNGKVAAKRESNKSRKR
jgi:hypothetical protein